MLGFTAGVPGRVVTFDLLPEIMRLANATDTSFTAPMVAHDFTDGLNTIALALTPGNGDRRSR